MRLGGVHKHAPREHAINANRAGFLRRVDRLHDLESAIAEKDGVAHLQREPAGAVEVRLVKHARAEGVQLLCPPLRAVVAALGVERALRPVACDPRLRRVHDGAAKVYDLSPLFLA